MTTPLILDVDTGVDDAMALLYAAASPEVELIAATCVMGNVAVEQVAWNTLAVLELAGLGDVEVAVGADRPLAGGPRPARDEHGARGLGYAVVGSPVGAPSPRSASELIAGAARERAGEVLLVATGPLTDVAGTLEREPALPRLLKGFVLMGGADAGTPVAGTNARADPDAAETVFRAFAGGPEPQLPVCVGREVTERARITRPDLDRIGEAAPASPLARFVADAVAFKIAQRERRGDPAGAPMHDALTLAIAIDPDLAELAAASEVDARVAVDVDATTFRERFVERLGALVHDRA